MKYNLKFKFTNATTIWHTNATATEIQFTNATKSTTTKDKIQKTNTTTKDKIQIQIQTAEIHIQIT